MPTPSLSSTSYNNSTSSLSLFSSSDMTTSNPIGMGDIFGAMIVGGGAYLLIVVPFLIGVISLSGYFFKNSQNNSNDNLSGMNMIRFILKPILYLMGGLFLFAFFSLMLKITFSINVSSWVKFFFEARYAALLGNIHATGQMKSVTEGALGLLDMLSTVMFWSIPIIYLVLYSLLAGYLLAIFIENGNADIPILKKIVVGGIVMVVSIIIITIYTSSINRTIFRDGLNIENLGQVYSIESTNRTLIKKEIRKRFGND